MLEIYDVRWVKSNLRHLLSNSEKVIFNNIDQLETNSNISITNDLYISSNLECNINFKNSHSIAIK